MGFSTKRLLLNNVMRICGIQTMYLIVVILSLIACSNQKQKVENALSENTARQQLSENKLDSFKVKTFLNSGNKITGWGYDIYKNNVLYVHQPNIPAISGERGFKSELAAKKMGIFVTQKIKNNVIPPSVSKEELESLQIE